MEPLAMLPIPLLNWYRENARDLPWRHDPSPYQVWVSEIMLQQTRVGAVMGYYARFMEAFPDIRALAEADEEKLMKCWQGLGYYSRARNLQKAAQQIMERHGGVFPESYPDIRALAGIGDYTAGAIASIAFGMPEPAVDGNLLRVSARILGDDGDILSPAVKKRLTAALRAVIPVQEPGRFNQAMMDLGAMVCLPNGAPRCELCPAAEFCTARREGRTAELPVRSPKKPRRVEERRVYLIYHSGKVALRRRPARGLLAKLWEYPNMLAEESRPQDWPAEWGEGEYAGTGRHIFTHVEWRMEAVRIMAESDALPSGWVWAGRTELEGVYAIPSAFADFRAAIEEEVR